MGTLLIVRELNIRWSQAAPALLLALVTLSTFFVLQAAGPESAIRQFHRAIENKDIQEAISLTSDGVADPNTETLINQIDWLLRGGHRYQIRRVQGTGESVVAAVEYKRDNGPIRAMVWVVEKRRGNPRWKINASKTLNILRDTLGLDERPATPSPNVPTGNGLN